MPDKRLSRLMRLLQIELIETQEIKVEIISGSLRLSKQNPYEHLQATAEPFGVYAVSYYSDPKDALKTFSNPAFERMEYPELHKSMLENAIKFDGANKPLTFERRAPYQEVQELFLKTAEAFKEKIRKSKKL